MKILERPIYWMMEQGATRRMRHTTILSGCVTYGEAFEVAAQHVGTRRKDAWRGRVRIRYRKRAAAFDVQVPDDTA